MGSEFWPVVGTIGAAIVTGLVALVVKRSDRKSNRSDAAQKAIADADKRVNDFIDQIQEQYKADREEWARQQESLTDRQRRTEARVEGLERRERVLLDYASLLRSLVKPPPPEWPPGLLGP